MSNFVPPPGTVAPPSHYTPPPPGGEPPAPAGEQIAWSSNAESKRPLVDLLHPNDPQPEAKPATPPPATASGPAAPKKSRGLSGVVVAGVVAVAVIAVAYVVLLRRPAEQQVAHATPTPAPTSSPTVTPTSTPSPTPSPSPSPSATPTPELTVSKPAETPTPGHPQAVTVSSKSGLWLRSSPTSVNRSNIIGWMPSGATVSVDSVGDFWWHGTYKGQSGYFASKYTQ